MFQSTITDHCGQFQTSEVMAQTTLADAERLIALLSRVVDKSSAGRLDYVPDNPHHQLNTDSKQPKRLCSFLDALAFLLVSKEKGEVISLSMRKVRMKHFKHSSFTAATVRSWLWYDAKGFQKYENEDNKEFLELMVGTNEGECYQTAQYLHRIWGHLKRISQELFNQPAAPRGTTSRGSGWAGEDLPPHLTKSIDSLIRTLLQNSWQQISKRIGNKYKSFSAIKLDSTKVDPKHPWFLVEKFVTGLYLAYIAFGEASKPKTPAEWDTFYIQLYQTMQSIDRFITRDGPGAGSGGFGSTMAHVKDPKTLQWDYGKYLSKIASIPKEILTLRGVANSRQCKEIFDLDFVIRPAYRLGFQSTPPLPNDAAGWVRVFNRAVLVRNGSLPQNEPLELVKDKASQAIFNRVLTEKRMVTGKKIHAETRVATTIILERQRGVPEGFTYIGVSKLCCRPCHELLMAMREFDVHFVVRGEHGKSYYPWTIPKELLDSPLGADLMRTVESKIATKFCELCHTDFFQVASQDIRADDTDRTVSTDKKVGPSMENTKYQGALADLQERAKKLQLQHEGKKW